MKGAKKIGNLANLATLSPVSSIFFLSNIKESAANPPSPSDKPVIKKGLACTVVRKG